jgi:hypothetical protein
MLSSRNISFDMEMIIISCASASNSLSCLRSADVSALEAANTQIGSDAFFGTFTFVPVVDGELIRERPSIAFKEGKFNGVSIKYSLSLR